MEPWVLNFLEIHVNGYTILCAPYVFDIGSYELRCYNVQVHAKFVEEIYICMFCKKWD